MDNNGIDFERIFVNSYVYSNHYTHRYAYSESKKSFVRNARRNIALG